MQEIEKTFEEEPVAFLCEGMNNIKSVIDSLANQKGRSGDGENFVQLFNYSKRNMDRIAPAYVTALLKHHEGSLRSSSAAIEMLLLVAGKHNIREAIDFVGVKEGKEFILFATNADLAADFAKKNRIKIIKRYRLYIDPAVASEVAKLGLSE